MTLPEDPLLSARALSVTFGNGVRALTDVDVDIARGEIVGLVGESGSGKSTLANVILRLVDPDQGTLDFDGQSLLAMGRRDLLKARRRLQVVPQDPTTSLNPRLTVASSIEFNLRAHGWDKGRRRQRVAEVLDLVGLAQGYGQRYPHELSGGQNQRVAIARALATGPELVVCDEAVSALDKSVQAQILNLIADLQRGLAVAFLFISHDLTVVEHVSDRVLVMYLGRIVETGPAGALLAEPRHPYTQALLASVPVRGQARLPLRGDAPNPAQPPSGCPFRTRCPFAVDACASYDHKPTKFEAGHLAACLRAEEISPRPLGALRMLEPSLKGEPTVQ